MNKKTRAAIDELPPPLPQVGAILHLDTRLPQEDTLLGNQHWKLSGSCVLAGARRILTLLHVMDPYGDAAVFFPYRGIFMLKKESLKFENGTTQGDDLALVDLESPIDCVPLKHHKISSHFKYDGFAAVCGYGLWHGTPLEGLDGLQQRHIANLGLNCKAASGRPTHYDNLDLIWTASRNGGLAAGRANSGGPLLWGADQKVHPDADGPPDDWGRDSFRYVALSRERKRDPGGQCDLQISAWIGWCRKRWLDGLSSGNGGAARCENLAHRSVVVSADPEASPTVVEFPIPEGSRKMTCTLNATDGLRLQMRLAFDAGENWLADIHRDNHASGRFLVRETEVAEGAKKVSVGLAPYERAPVEADEVAAQICCRFV